MINFTLRNLRVFFKDKTAVFFSLLAVFVIIGLYVLFLGDVWSASFADVENARFIMDSWIMAGILAVTSFTTTMGAFGIMIEDKAKKINKDLVVSPIKTTSLVGGYIFSSVIIGVIMSLVTLVLAEIYIVIGGGELLSMITFMKVLGLVLLATFTNSSIVLFMVSFFDSLNAFSTASTVVGTLIGFLTGIYLPIGQLPAAIQWLIKLFPVSHAASLFRQVMMQAPLSVGFKNFPTEYVDGFKEFMGVTFLFNDYLVTPIMSILILIVTGFVFYALSVFKLTIKHK
ncbi:MAG: ABC transporter permease [Erysipelotrichaceae bacterium]|nr:ABC transporter permease [Erysipelotrichaceae bacterium]MDD4642442.1 ABC transporter permease [Erysipelotrichaceae bacterium]